MTAGRGQVVPYKGLLTLGAMIGAASTQVVGAAPSLFVPGVVSTGDSESHATLSPDGQTLYFVKLTPDFAHWTIVVSKRVQGHWSEPVVAPFSGRWDDSDLSFSPDGKTIYFVSNRPADEAGERRPDVDIFRMQRTADGWSTPQRITELSSSGNEWYPNQAANGTLYFGSERRPGNLGPEGTSDLWRARWLGDHFGEPENLGAVINTNGQDIEAWVAPDETTLVFAAKGRSDGLGSYDLYASRYCAGAWTTPRPLSGGINSAGWEFGGRFSPDGSTFYFGSNLAESPAERTLTDAQGYRELTEQLRSPHNGLFDIYTIPSSELAIPQSCESVTG